LRIAARNGISKVRVFGSVARGESVPKSDLDLLVDVEDGRSLFSLIAAKQEIEELIGPKVDIVSEDSLRGPRREWNWNRNPAA
jgi:predicted nucleotidyltransferase